MCRVLPRTHTLQETSREGAELRYLADCDEGHIVCDVPPSLSADRQDLERVADGSVLVVQHG